MNLHAADDLRGVCAGIESIAVPLRARIAPGAPFGVGAYLPAAVAHELDRSDGGRSFARFLAERGLDPFTWNAFPYGGFHRRGLKRGVFRPAWWEPERAAFTLAVARVAAACAGEPTGGRHVSVSTHTGAFGADVADDDARLECAVGFARAAVDLAALERASGHRVVLSLEAEPRASAGNTEELVRFLWLLHARAPALVAVERELDEADVTLALERHVGACLDACHAAVEFEEPERAVANATMRPGRLGKLQFSSALSLPRPDEDEAGRERLFALAEDVFLHQTTARRADGTLARALDLPELAERWRAGDAAWRGSVEWRCHFHVPVDAAGPFDPASAGGLATTRAQADAILARALERPEDWGTDELHVEIETYTWDVLPALARGPGALVDGLEREYRHVMGRLVAAGWRHAV